MGFFGLTFERRYPVFGFGDDMRAMTADEILQMQFNQSRAMQNAYCDGRLLSQSLYSLCLSQAQYAPHQKPLDERFADFKTRLALAIAKRGGK